MDNQLKQHTGQKQELSQQLSARQYQALEILGTPTMDLEAVINRYLEQNPVLELDYVPGEMLAGDLYTAGSREEIAPDVDGDRLNRDDGFAELAELADGWQELAPSGTVDFADKDTQEAEHRYFFDNAGAEDMDLESPAMQLRFSDAPQNIIETAEQLLEHIDDRGFLEINLADFAFCRQIDMYLAQQALDLIQSLEPAGIGARDLAECLMLQLKRKDPQAAAGDTGRIITNHLDDLIHNRLPGIAKTLKLTVEEVEACTAVIKKLSPAPCRKLEQAAQTTAEPDFALLPDENGELVISGRDRWLPGLKISPAYLKMLEEPDLPAETRAYLEEKIQNARELFEMLSFRYDTLYRVTESLAELQREYFLSGQDKLRPLTLKQVADRLGIHETTVSRAVNGKSIRTRYGTIPYKQLFAGGYRVESGEEIAAGTIKDKLKEIIAAEDPRHPLSDDAIAGKLQGMGFPVARRTVAKYRTQLGILATSMRRQHS